MVTLKDVIDAYGSDDADELLLEYLNEEHTMDLDSTDPDGSQLITSMSGHITDAEYSDPRNWRSSDEDTVSVDVTLNWSDGTVFHDEGDEFEFSEPQTTELRVTIFKPTEDISIDRLH